MSVTFEVKVTEKVEVRDEETSAFDVSHNCHQPYQNLSDAMKKAKDERMSKLLAITSEPPYSYTLHIQIVRVQNELDIFKKIPCNYSIDKYTVIEGEFVCTSSDLASFDDVHYYFQLLSQ
jgi:hypothetical protein